MSQNAIELTVVTPERAVVNQRVDEVQIPGSQGYLGVLPGHAALFSEMRIGAVSYRIGGQWTYLSVAWGFAEVLPNQVRILAETAERASEIDADRAKRSRERAEKRLSSGNADVNYERAMVALERAMIRMQVSGKTSSSHQES